MAETNETSTKGDVARRLAHKALMPIVATAASAAAGYAAKKAPPLIEAKVLPKLKEAVSGVGSAVEDIPAHAKSAAGNVGDLADGLAQKAKDAVPGVGGGGSFRRGTLSSDELARHVQRRAEARAARRKTTTKR
jgi:hypothetical protein